jgi:phage terminase small subunit
MKLFKGLTERQKKFAEVYVTSSGILSNTECAIEGNCTRE